MNPLIPAIITGILGSAPQAPGPVAPETPQMTIRPMPQGAVKAVMEPPAQGYARFGNKTLHLAPGLQIRDAQNRIVQPITLQQPVPVRYLVDAGGDVNRVWVLTPEEAARSDPQQ
ncbi:MAG: hypothetical protein C0522_02875 [Rhodocyclaceae bacterium]|jgi:hypothetical protein|nr:hypothetical protein [Rhodocyclaceae bacterium]